MVRKRETSCRITTLRWNL